MTAKRPRRPRVPSGTASVSAASVGPAVDQTVAPKPPVPESAAPPIERPPAVVAPGFAARIEAPSEPSADRAPRSAPVATPAWPPVGDPGPAPLPAIRIPAGAYLAPSAVLPPLDAPSLGNGHGGGAGHIHRGADGGSATSTTRASVAETLEAFGLTSNAARRLVGVGAAIAGLGFVLPWASVLAGSGLIGDYWARWGLAGPGHWIVVLGLLALIGLALAGDPVARVPVGGIAIAVGALLVGLLWPYLFGLLGHSVGVWVVLVGAILVAVGGALDVRRHEPREPVV
jgi:hypothetical protein